jgi:hypothetical protein
MEGDRTHEGGIRSPCLPALCPARLPARRPSVTRSGRRRRPPPRGARRRAADRAQRVRQHLPALGECRPHDLLEAGYIGQPHLRLAQHAQMEDARVDLRRRAERARGHAKCEAHVTMELGENGEAPVGLAAGYSGADSRGEVSGGLTMAPLTRDHR